jgi:hypothetical protein
MGAVRDRYEGLLDQVVGIRNEDTWAKAKGLPWRAPPDVERGFLPWCMMIKFKPGGAERARPVELAYFATNPVTLYETLFTERNTAPQFIFLNRPADVPVGRWQAFVGADGALAKAVRDNPLKPKYVSRDIFDHALA